MKKMLYIIVTHEVTSSHRRWRCGQPTPLREKRYNFYMECNFEGPDGSKNQVIHLAGLSQYSPKSNQFFLL